MELESPPPTPPPYCETKFEFEAREERWELVPRIRVGSAGFVSNRRYNLLVWSNWRVIVISPELMSFLEEPTPLLLSECPFIKFSEIIFWL